MASCSYEARRLGVRSAMPVRRALRLCPRRRYRSRACPATARFPKRSSPSSGSTLRLWKRCRSTKPIWRCRPKKGPGLSRNYEGELRLPLSVEVLANKLLAKTACELVKPDGMKELWPKDVHAVLWPPLDGGQTPIRNRPGEFAASPVA